MIVLHHQNLKRKRKTLKRKKKRKKMTVHLPRLLQKKRKNFQVKAVTAPCLHPRKEREERKMKVQRRNIVKRQRKA